MIITIICCLRDTVINIKVANKHILDRKCILEGNESVHMTSKIIFPFEDSLFDYN